MMMLPTVLALAIAGCTGSPSAGAADKAKSSSVSKVEGTYTNPEGNASVEFMAGGKAHFSLVGAGGACTFKQVGNKVTLNLEGEEIVFTVNGDGSLTGPEGYLSRLKKKKE